MPQLSIPHYALARFPKQGAVVPCYFNCVLVAGRVRWWRWTFTHTDMVEPAVCTTGYLSDVTLHLRLKSPLEPFIFISVCLKILKIAERPLYASPLGPCLYFSGLQRHGQEGPCQDAVLSFKVCFVQDKLCQ